MQQKNKRNKSIYNSLIRTLIWLTAMLAACCAVFIDLTAAYEMFSNGNMGPQTYIHTQREKRFIPSIK